MNLDRAKIKKLLLMGLLGTIMTGIGDFLLGYGENVSMEGLAGALMGNAQNLSDAQLIAGSLLGFVGLLLEGFGFFGIYRLMVDGNSKSAHLYRVLIIFYIWLAPIGCHMNVGIFNITFKYLLESNVDAIAIANKLLVWFWVPIVVLLVIAWAIMLGIAFKTFKEEKTPYPSYAKWFNMITGCIPTIILGYLVMTLVPNAEALGSAIMGMCLSVGNALTFGGLLAKMPSEVTFKEFRNSMEMKDVKE